MDINAIISAVLMATAVAALMYAFVYPYLSGDIRAEKRAAAIAAPARDKSGTARQNDPAKRRKAIAETLKEMEGVTKKKRVTIEQRIAQAGLTWSKSAYIITTVGLGLFLAGLLFVVNGNLLAVAGGFIVGMWGAPSWLLSFLRNRRIRNFVEEFPTAIDVVVRGIRAGLPVGDCFRVVASEARDPVRSEFRFIVESQSIGLSIAEATERFAERMPIPEASFFAIVVGITQKTGGNLSEALNNLSTVLRDRKKMRGKIQAMSSEAKTSAMIIGALPFLVGTAVFFLQPDYIMVLFVSNAGKIVVAACFVWMAMGVFVMRKMINFDF
ncbi:MAG TPA: type II secretion system F family protein [Methylocystis sp.]|nr:type II secretion system F family protein [Methylocystis sp.]